jgi:hypothetical protein
MKPPITTTFLRASGGSAGGETRRFREDGRGLRMAMVGDDHFAGIDMHRGQAEVFEGQRHDVAREALAVA